MAIATVDGPRPAPALVDALASARDLEGYYLLHATPPLCCAGWDRGRTAAKSYSRALELVTNDGERRFLQRRRRESRR